MKTNRLFILVFVSLFLKESYAQYNLTWEITFNANTNSFDSPVKMITDSTAGFTYILGQSRQLQPGFFQPTSKAFLLKYETAAGSQNWGLTDDTLSQPRAMCMDKSDNLYLAGANIDSAQVNYSYRVMKYDRQGTRWWIARADDNLTAQVTEINALAVDAGGSVYAGGGYFNTNGTYVGVLIKYNTDGVKQWAREYIDSGSYQGILSIETDADDNVYAMLDDFTLIKYTSDGTVVWANSIFSPDIFCSSRKLIKGADGSFYLAGTFNAGGIGYRVARVNANGQTAWTQDSFDIFPGFGDMSYDITLSPDQKYLYLTGFADSSFYGSFIQLNAANGNIIWKKVSEDNKYEQCQVKVHPDGRLIMAGLKNNSFTGLQDMFMEIYDSEGKLTWSRLYPEASNFTFGGSVNEIALTPTNEVLLLGSVNMNRSDISIHFFTEGTSGINPVADAQHFQIFPNPFNGHFTVTTTGESTSHIHLYDLTGKLLLNEVFTGPVYQVEADALAAGVYFYTILGENGILQSGKLIAR